ncbi:hypothetical protein D9613_009573 [Agrocybe pediades]|uniref:Uncharacterized protein n=1 Tax=Agrocybe pediades TaxID=84607 RepID=A0A8H4R415_9AGAR|nr:hypothetical protein D9613_009573 [Agrocybe pediades]
MKLRRIYSRPKRRHTSVLFVSSSADSDSNLLPLHLNGALNAFSALTGTGPIGQFFYYQGRLTALDPEGSLFNYLTTFGSEYLGPSGGCSTYGSLGFFPGAGSNKCARYGTGFYLHSNEENSQLGATLVYNWVGGFYACGSAKEVVYKVHESDGRDDCVPIELNTVPVIN